MGGKPSGKAVRKSAAGRRAAVRERAKSDAGTRPKAKARTLSVASRLAAELDALKKDLTAARARVAELETRVDEDPLTGLFNRRGFERALERSLAYVRRYAATAALVYLDLDRFKPVNDRFGHAAGDWALGRVARIVAGNVRASDVVARFGGDELVVLLWNVNAAQVAEKARGLEALIDGEAFAWDGKKFALGLSAGAVMLSADDTVVSALERADAAMYARKRERASA
jgi:diguanylate cyclase (GGDEF)-like protein